jgi:hypothetical protein
MLLILLHYCKFQCTIDVTFIYYLTYIFLNVNFRYLRDMNINRKEVEIKIAKGTVTKNDMMGQLKFELQLFDSLIKKIDVSLCLLYLPNHLYQVCIFFHIFFINAE